MLSLVVVLGGDSIEHGRQALIQLLGPYLFHFRRPVCRLALRQDIFDLDFHERGARVAWKRSILGGIPIGLVLLSPHALDFSPYCAWFVHAVVRFQGAKSVLFLNLNSVADRDILALDLLNHGLFPLDSVLLCFTHLVEVLLVIGG